MIERDKGKKEVKVMTRSEVNKEIYRLGRKAFFILMSDKWTDKERKAIEDIRLEMRELKLMLRHMK